MVNALPISSRVNKQSPVHVLLKADGNNGLKEDSIVLTESGWNLNKFQLDEKLGNIDMLTQKKIAECMMIQFPMIKRALLLHPDMCVFS